MCLQMLLVCLLVFLPLMSPPSWIVAVLSAIVCILPLLTVLSVRLTGWSPQRMQLFAPLSPRVRASCSHAPLGAPPTACCCLAPLSFPLCSPTRPWSVTIHFLVMAMPLTSRSTLILSLPLIVMSSVFGSAVASSFDFSLYTQPSLRGSINA